MSTYTYDIAAADIPGKMFAAVTPSLSTWHTIIINVAPGVIPRRRVTIVVSADAEISPDNAGAAKTKIPANQPFDIEIGGSSRSTYYINGAATYTLYLHVSG